MCVWLVQVKTEKDLVESHPSETAGFLQDHYFDGSCLEAARMSNFSDQGLEDIGIDRSLYEAAETEPNEGSDETHVIEVNPDGTFHENEPRNIDFGGIAVPNTVEQSEELPRDNSAVIQEFDPFARSTVYRDQQGDDVTEDDISSLGLGPAIEAGDQNLQSGLQDEGPPEEEDEDL